MAQMVSFLIYVSPHCMIPEIPGIMYAFYMFYLRKSATSADKHHSGHKKNGGRIVARPP